jgi:ATP-binding cassette subfamily B protein
MQRGYRDITLCQPSQKSLAALAAGGETAPVTPGDESRDRSGFRLAVEHYGRRLWADRRWSAPALLLPGSAATLTWFCPPLVLAAMVRRFAVGDKPSVDDLLPYLLAFAGVWYVGELVWRVSIHFLNRAGSAGAAELYSSGMDELYAKDLSFFHDSFAGSLTKKVVGYASGYAILLDTLAFQIASQVLPLAFVCVILWRISPWLVFVLVTMVGATAVAVAPLILRRQRLVERREAASNDVAAHIADSITNIDAVRLFGRERDEAAVHARNVERWRRLALRSWDYSNRRIDMITSPIYVLTNVAGILLAVALADDPQLDIPAILVTFAFYSRFTQVVWEFNQIYRTIETQLSTAAQFTQLLLEPPVVVDPPMPDAPAFRDASIQLRDVWFRYPKRDESLFRGLDLRIADGERVGLVGRSGGGKTSLTRLLLRIADIDAGSIRIGGCDIARLRQADVRAQIAYVPQDPVMFHRSLRDNIAFGRPDATDDDVRAAADAAHATEFIDELPLGYDTLVGERGIKLSGGQRQRLAIARAFLRHAPILILDEATSSLDSASEALIQHALLTLMESRTALVIAHRLSTVRAMDRLIVLEDGEVVEHGTHEELLGADNVYAAFWRTQSGGFLGSLDPGADGELSHR